MIRKIIFLLAAFSLSFTFVSVSLADAAVSIRYGKIDSVKTVEKEASHAGGAICGLVLVIPDADWVTGDHLLNSEI